MPFDGLRKQRARSLRLSLRQSLRWSLTFSYSALETFPAITRRQIGNFNIQLADISVAGMLLGGQHSRCCQRGTDADDAGEQM